MSGGASEWASVLDYWVGPNVNTKKWFFGGKEGDKEIKEKFGDLIEKARNGGLKSWEENPKGAIALIILIDQFCRSVYRSFLLGGVPPSNVVCPAFLFLTNEGTPGAFSHDPVSLQIAKSFLPGGKHNYKELTIRERYFVFIALEHSENMEDQDTSVKLFTELVEDTKGTENEELAKGGLKFAEQHREVVSKFGRFPKRNKVLERENTPEEEAFLKDNPYVF